MKKIVLLLLASFVTASVVSAQNIVLTNGLYTTDKGDLYSGAYAVYAQNNVKEANYIIVNGKLNGDAVYYYADGSIMETGKFVNNEKDGQWLRMDEAGHKIAEAYYVSGKKDGTWLIWDASGIKRYEMVYSMGVKTGKWLMWDENGKLSSEKNYSGL